MARMQALMRRNSGLASRSFRSHRFRLISLAVNYLLIRSDQTDRVRIHHYGNVDTQYGKVVSKDSLMLQLYPDAELGKAIPLMY